VSQPDFSSDHFLEEAQQQDVVADEAIQRDLDARRRHAQTEALIGGAVYFALPLVTLYAGARTLARVRRRFPSVTYSHLWIAAALVGAWLSFWWAAEDGRGDFTDGQWRLVGFTLLGLAGWRATRHSPRD
jgi:hypothetical protein